MFITTANSCSMPQPLLDRMEIIRIPGYTEDEKVEIAKRHLIAKQSEANGLKAGEWSISDEALRDMVRYYTREAGVRNLEREIASLARKAVQARRRQEDEEGRDHAENLEQIRRACAGSATARRRRRTWSAWSPAWPGPRWAARS